MDKDLLNVESLNPLQYLHWEQLFISQHSLSTLAQVSIFISTPSLIGERAQPNHYSVFSILMSYILETFISIHTRQVSTTVSQTSS